MRGTFLAPSPDEGDRIVVFGGILMGVAVGLAASVRMARRRLDTVVVYPLLGMMGAVIGGVAGSRSAAAVAGAVLVVALYAVTAGRSPRSPVPRSSRIRVGREVS